MVIYPLARVKEVLRFYSAFSKVAPDELTTYAGILNPPDGDTVVALICCYCGPLEKGEESIRPLRSFGPPAQDMLGPTAYAAHQRMFDLDFLPALITTLRPAS